MLVLTVKRDDSILITTASGEEIWLQVHSGGASRTKLGFTTEHKSVKFRVHKGKDRVPTANQPRAEVLS